MLLKNASILVVDDDPDILTAVRLLLKTECQNVMIEKNPGNIRSLLTSHHLDLIMLDMNFTSSIHTGNEGLFWLREIKKIKQSVEVIMITAYGDIDLAVSSLKEGASDFMVKPWRNEKLIDTIKTILKKKDKNHSADGSQSFMQTSNELIGCSEVMRDIFYKIEKIAPTDANILILGENGTGKDLVAKAIHQHSLRSSRPFIKVDVGALTDSLFESELFGHKKGAFTDARDDRTGRFEAANGGTLFLDEIGNISLQQQAKLLSVLQNRQVVKIGTNEPVPVDIRLVCATNLPLAELANENKFRKDLIYRINTVEIIIPPLRKREGDIILLADHFCSIYCKKYSKSKLEIDRTAKDKLINYHYPGNVRELQYAIERAVIMAESDRLKAEDIIFSPLENTLAFEIDSEDHKLSNVEKNTILKVVQKHGGNITKAAKELGLTRTALYRRINKYEI